MTLLLKMIIYSEFSHWTWSISIAMFVYQRVGDMEASKGTWAFGRLEISEIWLHQQTCSIDLISTYGIYELWRSTFSHSFTYLWTYIYIHEIYEIQHMAFVPMFDQDLVLIGLFTHPLFRGWIISSATDVGWWSHSWWTEPFYDAWILWWMVGWP